MFHPVEFLMNARDGLKNLVSKIGHPSKDKAANWVWDFAPLTGPECLAMYTSDWLPRKIVDIVPQDATREWRKWQAKDKQAEKLYALEKALKVRSKIMRAMQLDRLFGGSAILIGTGDKDIEEPLDVTKIKQNGIKYLRVFSRYDLRAGDLVNNIEDDAYGLPQWYELLRQRDGKDVGLKIHRSRFVFFISNPLPTDWLTYNANPEVSGNSVYAAYDSQIGWGQSIYEPIRKALVNAGAVAENVAALVEEAKLDIIQVPNLISYMNNDESQSKLISRFSLASLLKANNNMLLLGGDEKFDRKQISFAQLPEIMNANLQIASGAADIPIVRLLGQSPSGLNASGDTDMRMHYDKIKSHQTNDLKEGCLVDLDEAFIRSALGGRPEEIDYEFDSLWQMSEPELADVSLKKSQAFMQINGLGLFAPEELRPAVADVIVDDGFLPTLDQHLLSEEEANNVLEEQQKQQLEQQQQLSGQGNSPNQGNNPPQNQTPQADEASDWIEFLDANPDIAYDSFEETAHPRGPGGRWSDKPGMGNKTKTLPWWQRGEKPEQPKQAASKEATPGTGGQGGKPKYALSLEILNEAAKNALPKEHKVYKGGEPVETKTKIGKQDTGKLAEKHVLNWLKEQGLQDAQQLNAKISNYPVDLFAGNLLIEVKGGLISNSKKARRWRASIGQPSKTEQAHLDTLTPEEKFAHNAAKDQAIMDRKQAVLDEYSQKLNQPVKGVTITTIFHPDEKTFDLHVFEGFHKVINWDSEEAKNAYRGTFKHS